MAFQKVINHEAKIHTIGYGYGPIAGGQGTKVLSLRLLPGMNEVVSDDWQKAKAARHVQHLLSTRKLEEVGAAAVRGLGNLSIVDARSTVEQTFDRELLNAWKLAERRPEVTTAIDQQVDKITYKPERDAPGAEETRLATDGMTANEVVDAAQAEQVPVQKFEKPSPPPPPAPTAPARPKTGAGVRTVGKRK